MSYIMAQTGPDPEFIDEISYAYYVDEGYDENNIVYTAVDKCYINVYGGKIADMVDTIGVKNDIVIDSETSGMPRGGEFTYYILNEDRHAVYEVLSTNISYEEHMRIINM